MECPVEHHETREDGKHRYRCPRCERLTGWTPYGPEKYHRQCTAGPGAGDRVSALLASIGIVPKKNCGCKSRQEKLNKAGEKVRRWLQGKKQARPESPSSGPRTT